MASDKAPPFYVDEPLPLIPTPAFETGKNDHFTMGASHMALSHNSIIRGYNSIYQQAPRLSSSDYPDFIGYCIAWHRFVEEHHHHEETGYFPAIEQATGVKAVMDGDVDQHATFHNGLNEFRFYLINLLNPTKDFKPARLLEIMDSFSTALHAHLIAEPQHLLALSRFGKDIDLVKIEQDIGKKNMTLEFALNVLPIFMNNMESVEFEGGRWKGYPEVPGAVRWVIKSVFPLWNRRWWRFMSCDSGGRRKRMVA